MKKINSLKFLVLPMILIFLISNVSALIVLSSGQTQFYSNDPSLGGQRWLIFAELNGQGQSVVGSTSTTIPASSITAKGVTAKNDVSIDATVDRNYCNSPLQTDGGVIYTARKYQMTGLESLQVWRYTEICQSQAKSGEQFLFGEAVNAQCYYKSTQAVHGVLGNPTSAVDFTIKSTIAGSSEQLKLSTLGQKSAVTSNKRMEVSYTGLVSSGEPCPINQNLYDAVYKEGIGWLTIDSYSYSVYRSKDSLLTSCLSDASFNQNLVDSCINDYNNAAYSALLEKKIAGSSYVSQSSLNSGQVSVDLQRSINFPQMAIRLDANWVGVFLPVSQPSIVGKDCQTFQTGKDGSMIVSVKNNANVDGAVEVQATCQSPISVSSPTQTKIIGAGQTTDYVISVVGTTGLSSCQIVARDAENPSVQATSSVSCEATGIKGTCTQGQEQCSGNTILVCDSDGAYKADLTRTCGNVSVASQTNFLFWLIVGAIILVIIAIGFGVKKKRR